MGFIKKSLSAATWIGSAGTVGFRPSTKTERYRRDELELLERQQAALDALLATQGRPHSEQRATPSTELHDSPAVRQKPQDNASTMSSRLASIERLAELVHAGILTTAEFDAQKSEILGTIGGQA